MPFRLGTFEQVFPGLARFVPMFRSAPISERAAMIIGKLGGKFRRQSLPCSLGWFVRGRRARRHLHASLPPDRAERCGRRAKQPRNPLRPLRPCAILPGFAILRSLRGLEIARAEFFRRMKIARQSFRLQLPIKLRRCGHLRSAFVEVNGRSEIAGRAALAGESKESSDATVSLTKSAVSFS